MKKKYLFKQLALVALMLVINVNGAWALPPRPVIIVINFDMQGHGTQVDQQQISSGDNAIKPPTPLENGYEFRAWYTEKDCINKFDFDQSVTATKDSTITLYARWRNDAEWAEFQKNLNEYSYVEYDSAYTESLGFKVHLATSADEAVETVNVLFEASKSVQKELNLNNEIFIRCLMSLIPPSLNEIGNCYTPLLPNELKNFAQVIACYEQLPYRHKGMIAVYGIASLPLDMILNTWAETNYNSDVEVCKCVLNSDILFKSTARMMEVWQLFVEK